MPNRALRRLLPLIALAAACEPPGEPAELRFDVYWRDAAIGCAGDPERPALTDLRLYVHDVEFESAAGRRVPFQLEPVEGWQTAEVALVDLEDGSGHCLNGTPARRAVVTGRLPAGDYRALHFRVGVPEPLNHGDPLAAKPPLTNTAMHWHWRSGYKFMRAGIATADDGAWLHLGSARCRGVIGDLAGCDSSNRARVVLQGFRPGEDLVVLDLARLFGDTDLGDGVLASCQVGPDEAACGPILESLGLEFASGESARPAAAFRSIAVP